jgi:cell division transport system permease protein
MFSIKLAIQSIKQEKMLNLLSVISISIGLFILSVVFLFVYNVEKFTQELPEKFAISIYLNDEASLTDKRNIENTLNSDPLVKSVDYISKEAALIELKTTLKKANYVFQGIDDNPLFASFIVWLNPGKFDIDIVKTFIKKIKQLKGVESVESNEKLLETISSLKNGLRVTTTGILLTFVCAMIFICYTTVKILFYRHGEEIEIYKLLGATRLFIRIPFLFEGGAIGFAGGIIAAISVMLAYYFFSARFISIVPIFSSIAIPMYTIYIIPFVGLFLGITGAALAIGRLKY